MQDYFLFQEKKFLITFFIKIFPTKNPDKIAIPEPGPQPTSERTVFDIPKIRKERAKESLPKLYGNFF